MTADVELPEPAASYGRGCNIELSDGQALYTEDQLRTCVAHATAAKDAEIEALRAEVDRWRLPFLEWLDKTEWVQQTVKPGELGHHRADVMRLRLEQAEARAERLAEALREARDYVATALREEREKFAGHEDCSDIPGIEADLHKIDTALNHTAAQENDDA